MPDDALISRLVELGRNVQNIGAELDASGNVLELEINEDSDEMRSAFENLHTANARAKLAIADLRAIREGVTVVPPAIPRRSQIDDGD